MEPISWTEKARIWREDIISLGYADWLICHADVGRILSGMPERNAGETGRFPVGKRLPTSHGHN